MTARYAAEVLARIRELCEADAEREVCGFVVRCGGILQVIPVPNVADKYHERDPARFPRTSRTSYLMDPRAQLRVHESLLDGQGEIVAVWHSHVDVGAYFSDKDREDALVEGEPLLPGAEYLVLGVKGGKVDEVRRYVLDGGGFAERPLT